MSAASQLRGGGGCLVPGAGSREGPDAKNLRMILRTISISICSAFPSLAGSVLLWLVPCFHAWLRGVIRWVAPCSCFA